MGGPGSEVRSKLGVNWKQLQRQEVTEEEGWGLAGKKGAGRS